MTQKASGEGLSYMLKIHVRGTSSVFFELCIATLGNYMIIF
jgi:hypothetical protein